MQQQQTNNQNNLTFLKSNYKYKRRNMRTTRALPLKARKPNQLAATLSKAKTSAATAATAIAAAVGTTICRKCSTILILFIVIIWKTLQAMANCLHYTGRIIANANGHNDVDYVADADDDGNAYVNASHDHDVNAASVRHSHLHSHSLSHSHSHPYSRTSHVSYRNNNNNNDKFDANDEVSTAREQQQQQRQHQQQQRQQHQQQQQIQQQQQNLSSSSPQKCSRCTTTPAATASSLIATTTTRDMSSVAGKSGLPLMTLLIALLLSMRLASAGTCWQTHLGSGKCNQIFSTNITKSDCCGASQTFSYTDRELSSVEYFFATAIGGGVECAPCIETCKGFKCGPNKKCVKRKGRPKCVCAPECGATLRRKQQQLQQQQHHSVTEQQQQQWASSLLSSSMTTRGSRSLSSEILSSNLSDDINNNKNSKNGADNQRKQQKQQQQQEQRPQRMPKRESQARGAQGETKHRRLLIIDSGSSSSTNLQKQPTTRRLRMEHTSNSNSNSSRGRGSGGKVQMQMKVEMERMTPPLPGAVRGNERRGHKKIKSTSSNSSKSSDSNNNGKHLTRSMTTATGANDSSATPAQTAQSRHKLANANEPANDINRQPQQQHQQQQQHQDNASARVRHQHQQQKQKHQQQQKHYGPNHEQQYDNETQQQQRRRSKHKHNHKDQQRKATNTTMSGFGFGSGSGSGSSGRRRLYLAEPGSETAASSSLSSHGHLDNADDLAFLAGIYEPAPMQQQHQHRQQQHSNPVCGSDGRTYNTECQLRKRACRTNNAQLEVAYRGHCKTSCNGVQCINGLSCVEDQYMMPHCISCKIECPWDDIAYDLDGDGRADDSPIVEERAVCGVDGKTYKSTCDINRMICKIGRSIAVAYPGPCRADRVTCADIKCGTKDTCLVDLQTHKPRCVSCRYKCARKQHRTPFRADKLCGNNNHTYNSWCEMRKDSCATGYYIGVRSTGVC